MSAKVFGGTLALKGAIEEQHASSPHCQDGCVCCAELVFDIFYWWLSEQTQYATPVHEHLHHVQISPWDRQRRLINENAP